MNAHKNILIVLVAGEMHSLVSLRLHKRLHPHQKDRKRPHLIAKYGMKCFWCGRALQRQTMTIDHYIPLSKGGSNKIKNLRLACASCNHYRGNAMPENTPEIIAEKSKIRFPSYWTPPKYHFGQWVKQGIIVGCDYYPGDSRPAYQYKEVWRYSVLPDLYADAESIETYQESEIEPFSPEELRDALEADIVFHELRLAELKKQLNQVSSHD